MKHTPEPWRLNKRASGNIENSHSRTVASCHGYSTNNDNGEHVTENDANAARIIACVNACAGIENPEDLRRQRDELKTALEDMCSVARGDEWHLATTGRQLILADVQSLLAKIKGEP